MMKDKFLKAEVQKNDGWIPIKTLLRFNRLSALTKDENAVLAAFKDNPSELVEVIETNSQHVSISLLFNEYVFCRLM